MPRGRATTLAVVFVAIVFAGLLTAVQRADRQALRAQHAAAEATGIVPPAPPAVSGATLTVQERL
jgi:hypothetical protein